MARTHCLVLAIGLVLCSAVKLVAETPGTLARVRAAGVLRCGVDAEEPEYTTADDHGNRAAFDADLCKAVAAAVLGEKAQVAVKAFPDEEPRWPRSLPGVWT